MPLLMGFHASFKAEQSGTVVTGTSGPGVGVMPDFTVGTRVPQSILPLGWTFPTILGSNLATGATPRPLSGGTDYTLSLTGISWGCSSPF